LSGLVNSFNKHAGCDSFSLEDARDCLRYRLQELYPGTFPFGEYVSVDAVLHYMLKTTTIIFSSSLSCPGGHLVSRRPSASQHCHVTIAECDVGSVQNWINSFHICNAKCDTCHTSLIRSFNFERCSPILTFDVSIATVLPNLHLDVSIQGKVVQYHLRGVIYFGSSHFISCIITANNQVWIHDGLEGRSTVYEGFLDHCDLSVCRGKTATIYIYIYLLNKYSLDIE
jgi:hypothetical protein